MKMDSHSPQETELNMTPMIDIVFQLIVFFLLTMKFKTIDQRIDSMLPNRGPQTIPVFDPPERKIKVKLFRRGLGDPQRAYTLLRVDNAAQFNLPTGWQGRALESPARVRQYDAVIGAVRGRIAAQLEGHGGNPGGIEGEIVAPAPSGGSVPHGDAVAVLDAFIAAGVTNVNFEGQAAPITRAARAARAAAR
jgi:biopolymer transport protein ExbD